eukprot:6490674-Amphidinium_carterae.1
MLDSCVTGTCSRSYVPVPYCQPHGAFQKLLGRIPSKSDGACRTDVRGFLMHNRVLGAASCKLSCARCEALGLSGPGRKTMVEESTSGSFDLSHSASAMVLRSMRRAHVWDSCNGASCT